jgi:hypothetical protein
VPGIINGDRWIADRLATLRRRLAEGPDDEERAEIEREIAVLSKERGLTVGGRRTLVPRFLRRVRRVD